MMLRVNGLFLDFKGEVEMESQIKIFEELDATYGDYSYAFDLPWNSHNLGLLGLPFPDNSSKIIYRSLQCDLLDDEGYVILSGLLRVQSLGFSRQITATFYSGNYNWIAALEGSVSDLYWEDYNDNLSSSNIINFTLNTEGVTFPILDNGGLITRSFSYLKVEDFIPCMYVKTIMSRIFNSAGIKIGGDLISDYVYNNAIIAKCLSNQADIEDRTSFVLKGSDQTIVSGAAVDIIPFTDDSTYPYFDGATNNYDTTNYRYTADKKMIVQVDLNLVVGLNNSADRMYIYVRRNSVVNLETFTITPVGSPADQSKSVTLVATLGAGQWIDVWVNGVNFLGLNTVIRGTSTIKFTPIFLYSFKGNEIVPNWTKQEFVSNVLNLLNVITDYNPATKELTLDLFQDIKSKEPIDLSKYITVQEANFSELIDNFGRQNRFSYGESDDEELRKYNVSEFVRYGQGVIPVDNDYINETADIVTSKFKAPVSYINGAFSMSLERLNFIDLVEGDSTNFTSVTDASGEARFNGINNIANDGDVVRITESSNAGYNGDWIAENTGAGFMHAEGLAYDSNATGKITVLRYEYTNVDDVFILINIPAIDVPDFSGLVEINLDLNKYSNFSYAYFNLLNVGKAVNTAYEQGLSFGGINNALSYQRSLLDTYWRNVEAILNDPVKIKAIVYLPKSVYLSLTPLRPIMIKTGETSNLYYLNRKRGYKSQSKPCELELIKLS